MASDDDLDILAWTMLGEAAGEGQQGMADVGHVVLNRLATGRWGDTIKAVAQSNKQFSTWNSGTGGNNPMGRFPKSSPAFQRARQLAQQVVAGQIAGPPGKPLDYHATSITPYWANSKDRFGAITRGNHIYYPSVPIPPGEIPNVVGTATDVVPLPAPAPATASPNLAALRNTPKATPFPATASKGMQAVRNGMFAQPAINPAKAMGLGDALGMSPIQGGTQQAPLFDAAYDTTIGAMRQVLPVNTQGMGTFATAPKPATMSAQMAGRRSVDPALQAALNQKLYGGTTVATIPTVPVALPRPRPNTTAVVATYPTPKPKPALAPAYNALTPQQKLALLGGGAAPIQSATLPQIPGPAGSINNSKDPSRLPALGGPAGNTQMIAAAHGIAPTQLAKIPPVPMPASMRPLAVATQLAVQPKLAPIPRARPNFGMGGPILQNPSVVGVAPVPQQRPRGMFAPSPVAQLQAMGMSSAQAYAALNSVGYRPTLDDRITGRSSSSGGGAQSISSM